MDHIIWQYLYRIFFCLSILSALVTAVFCFKYRVISLIKSAADVKRSEKKNMNETSFMTENFQQETDDVPYFAEISDDPADTDETDGSGNSTIVIDGSITETADEDDFGNSGTVIVPSCRSGDSGDPDVFVIIKDITIINGDTSAIKKYR